MTPSLFTARLGHIRYTIHVSTLVLREIERIMPQLNPMDKKRAGNLIQNAMSVSAEGHVRLSGLQEIHWFLDDTAVHRQLVAIDCSVLSTMHELHSFLSAVHSSDRGVIIGPKNEVSLTGEA